MFQIAGVQMFEKFCKFLKQDKKCLRHLHYLGHDSNIWSELSIPS